VLLSASLAALLAASCADGAGAGASDGAGADLPALADVQAVAASGDAGAYDFAVTLRSPDAGCDSYADWWEVLSEDGALLYRRVLNHSHTDEQPFTRSGGPVPASAEQVVIVRGHMSPGGYGGAAMRGSPAGGFSASAVAADFAAGVEAEAPLPKGCAY